MYAKLDESDNESTERPMYVLAVMRPARAFGDTVMDHDDFPVDALLPHYKPYRKTVTRLNRNAGEAV